MLNSSKTIFTVMLLALTITGCTGLGASFPRMYNMPYAVPDEAPKTWKLGWEHGCKSGFSAYGTDFHRTFYSFNQDVSYINDANYTKAWIDGFNYCRSFVNRYMAGDSFNSRENLAIISGTNMNIKPQDFRNTNAFNRPSFGGIMIGDGDYDIFGGVFDGMQSMGWGEMGWGGRLKSNWLNPSEHDWTE